MSMLVHQSSDRLAAAAGPSALAQAQGLPLRSLARRNLEIQWHQLRRDQDANIRLQVVMEGTGGEAGLGQRILDLERQLIVLGARKGEQDNDDRRIRHEEMVVQNAFQANDIPTIVSVLSGSGSHSLKNLYNRRLQITCLNALWKLCHKNAMNRSRFVNCGGIAAILTSTRIHATCQSFLHKATALVISLPFYNDSNAWVDLAGMAQPHKEEHGALLKRHKVDDDAMDTSIATLLIDTVNDQDPGDSSSHVFTLIAESVDLDLFHVRLNQPGDENGNYERVLAVKQIPVVCRDLALLVNDPPRLRRRLLFLRTCLASYLGDTSITTDTLGAIVL